MKEQMTKQEAIDLLVSEGKMTRHRGRPTKHEMELIHERMEGKKKGEIFGDPVADIQW